uniref:ANK_REP_REGION domain-containing protein n=1 Tax=Globodera pallida TaxID=36090 RepID=A0A183C731_GLOPA
MQSSMAATGEPQRLRYAFCVGVVGDECQLIFADDLSSVTLRPRIGECRLGRWFRMASLPDQQQRFSLLEHENGPFTTRVIGDGFSKRVQVQLPICFVPDLSAFGWHAMNEADRNKFYSPHLERAGQVWAMLDRSRIEPGHRYEALLSVEVDSIRQLPRWTLDSADDILGFSKLFAKTGSFGVPTSSGVVLRILPECDRNGHCLVAIRRHVDGRLAFGRIWNQNLSVGDIVDFMCIEACCRSLPLTMALDIAKSVQPESIKVKAVEFVGEDLFKLRVPLSAQLLADIRHNRMAGSLELANHGTLLDVDNVIGQKLAVMPKNVESGGGEERCFNANIRARLCLVPEKITPLWVLVGIESVEWTPDFGDIEELSVQASTPMTASTTATAAVQTVAATKQQQHVGVEALEEEGTAAVDEVGEEVQEEIRLEEEALVLFTHIVRMDLYMRFFDDREGKFTRNKCCNRDDLPPNFDTSDPPMPGSWAHIVYTVDCARDIQHIVIIELQPVDLATTTENLGAILRYAMMTVVPSNAHVWNALLETPRACTVQQLLSEAASEGGDFDDIPVNGVQPRANTNSNPTGVDPNQKMVAEAEQPTSVDDWGIAPDWQNVEYVRPLVVSRNGKNCTGNGQNAKIEQKAKACVAVENDENSVPLVPMSSSSWWAATTSAPASRTPTPLAKIDSSAQFGSTSKLASRKMAFANKETKKQKKKREYKERQQKKNVQQPENGQKQALSTIVLFIKSVGFEQHMRFYCPENVTFTQFRCCKRQDLPECPAVGTWARIVYTDISDQHIRVSFFKKLEYDENRKTSLTWAMKLVCPENARVWNSLSDQKNDWPMWVLEKINRSAS